MADYMHGQMSQRGQHQNTTSPYYSSSGQGQGYDQGQMPRAQQMVKAATAVTAGGSLLVLSALTLAGTVIALTVATPLLVIFSPVLVPATITVAVLVCGFLASGGFGVAALSVLAWIYRYMTGHHPPGADQLDQARMKIAGKTREAREKGEHLIHQATGGGGGATHQT